MPLFEATPAADLVTDKVAQALLRRHNVRLTGSGKPTLLFCNGFNCGQSVWRLLAPGLAEHYQLVFFDQVGAGKSDRSLCKNSRYNSLAGFVQDVLEICQTLQLRNIVVVGHSAGALIAMLAAIQAPELFAKTVLLGASPRYLNTLDYYGGFEVKDLSDMLQEMRVNYQAWANTFATMMIGQFHASTLSHELVDCATQADQETARRMIQLVFLGDYRAELPRLRQPTLLLQCTDDPAVPEEVSHYLLQHLPQAVLVNLPVSGHCPHLTAPLEVRAAIRQFVSAPVAEG